MFVNPHFSSIVSLCGSFAHNIAVTNLDISYLDITRSIFRESFSSKILTKFHKSISGDKSIYVTISLISGSLDIFWADSDFTDKYIKPNAQY